MRAAAGREQSGGGRAQGALLQEGTSPDLRLGGARVPEPAVLQQADAVPWSCSSPRGRTTPSRLFETSSISPQLLYVKPDRLCSSGRAGTAAAAAVGSDPSPKEMVTHSPAPGPRRPGTKPFSSPAFPHAVSVARQRPLGATHEAPTTDPKKRATRSDARQVREATGRKASTLPPREHITTARLGSST